MSLKTRALGHAATAAIVLGLTLGAPRLALAQSEVVEVYVTDAAGSVRVVMDSAGTVRARSDYLPFGESYSTSGALPAQQFTGQAREGETGQDDYNARRYVPRIGRFTRCDPAAGRARNPQSWNRYAYVLNNPLRYNDPTGRNENAFVVDAGGRSGDRMFDSWMDWQWYFGGFGGGGGGGSEGGGGGGEGGAVGGDAQSGQPTAPTTMPGTPVDPPGTPVPLPPGDTQVIDDTIEEILETEPRTDCMNNVMAPLGVSWEGFTQWLSQGHSSYDGVASQTPAGGQFAASAHVAAGRHNQRYGTVSNYMQNGAAPGYQITAVTFQSSPTFMAFYRPGRIQQAVGQGAITGLVMHEALHGYGARVGGLMEHDLQAAFKTTDITGHVNRNCRRF